MPRPFSASTKRQLLRVATRLFTDQGYAATSLDAIVSGAQVTKGALYHHFSGKQAVFEAVFEATEADAAKRIGKALRGHSDPWSKALAGLRCFLDVVQDPTYQRVVIQEGPAILGYERFREQEDRSTFAIVQDIVGDVLRESTVDLDAEMQLTFSRILFGAMWAAGESVTSADDPKLAVARIEAAIGFLLAGVQTLGESGASVPDPTDLLEAQRSDAE
ncbi:TetR/AcrR family transcriptional regulator [Alteromonas gracilis]